MVERGLARTAARSRSSPSSEVSGILGNLGDTIRIDGESQNQTRPLAAVPSPKPSCSARTASSLYLASMTQEIFISEVEMS